MSSQRLLAMGLLSKVPMRSTILQRFCEPYAGMKYSDYEKMHMTALYFTPGINQTWMEHQWKQLGLNPETAMSRVRKVAYLPKNRKRWGHLGERNVLFIGQPEVERFLLRRPMDKRTHIPNWCLPIFNDHLKSGWTKVRIAKHYRLHINTLDRRMKDSMFTPQYADLPERGNLWGKRTG